MALEKRLTDLITAFSRLEEAFYKTKSVPEDMYSFFRDAAIQRFEFTAELLWKAIKEFLKNKEGIECRSPKGCAREFFSAGYLSEEEVKLLLEMIDDRSLTFNTYHEEVAEKIFRDLKLYIPLIKKFINTLELKVV